MRRRFFYIIFVVLATVSVSIVGLHALYLKQARLAFIDQQVRQTAAALVDSKFGELRRREDFDSVDQLISEELGEDRIGKFFVVRNDQGEVVFESTGSKLLPLVEVPSTPQWITIDDEVQFVRVLNLKLPKIPNRTLQVGLVISQDLLDPGYFSPTSLMFLGMALALGFLVAWFLTSILFAPIQQLESFVTRAASQVLEVQEVPAIPESLKRPRSALALGYRKRPSDEFDRLLEGLDVLIARINRTYKLTRLWTYQMAHELKTPLAVLGIEVQKFSARASMGHPAVTHEIENVMQKMEATISSFLSWAELERHDPRQRIHANRIGQVMSEVVAQWESLFAGRVQVDAREDFYVFCDREHLKQALTNLVGNALQYSAGAVNVELKNQQVSVRDAGPGISVDVLERVGEPFNRGTLSQINSSVRGHGLGLAWVHAIARRYQWKFELGRVAPQGTLAVLDFSGQPSSGLG